MSSVELNAFDLLPHPIWIFGQDSLRIVAANAAACDWLGYDRDTIIGLNLVDLRPHEEHAAFRDRLAAFLADAALPPASERWRIRTRSGEVRHAAFHWREVRYDGESAILSTVTDLTRQHLAEEKVSQLEGDVAHSLQRQRLSDAKFRRLFDAAPGQMIVLTPGTYKIEAGTAEFARITATRPSDMRGRCFFDVFPPAPGEDGARGMEQLRKSFQRVEATRTADVMPIRNYPIEDSDGVMRTRYWSTINAPVLDDTGALEFIIHRVLDVTDLVTGNRHPPDTEGEGASTSELVQDLFLRAGEIEARLARFETVEARLRSAEDLLSVGAWEFDPATRKLDWSQKTVRLYGWTPDSAPPDLDGYVALVHPEDQSRMLSNLQRFEEQHQEQLVFEHRIVRPDGTVRHMRGVGQRHRFGGQERVVGAVQDITDIVGIEDALNQARGLLDLAGEKVRLGGWRIDLVEERVIWTPGTFRIHEHDARFPPTIDETIAFYAPEYRDMIESAFNQCATHGIEFDEVCELVTARGNRVWVRAIGIPVRNEHGQIVAVHGAIQDISDIHAAEQRATEALMQRENVLESISEAFFTLDDDWCFTYVNNQAEDLLGKSRNYLLGRRIWDEFPETVGSVFQKQYELVRADGQNRRFSTYFAPTDGWYEINANAVPGGLAIFARDITAERIQAERLRLLGLAVENLNDMVLVTKADRLDAPDGPEITFANPAVLTQTGYSQQDLEGQTPRLFQGPATSRAERSRIAKALRNGEPVTAELVNYRKNGEPYWIELNITPVRDEQGAVVNFVSIQRDITLRKQAEQDRRINEERFRIVASQVSDAIWDLDLRAQKQWWSPGLTEIFGHPRDPQDHLPTVWQAHIHPDDSASVAEQMQQAVSSGTHSFALEYRFRMGDGSWALVSDSGIILRDDEGVPIRMIGSVSNITEKRAEDDRRQQTQRLEAIGQLTGGVAHDFNNILTVILGNAELLLERLSEDQQARIMADVTVRAAERGAELTDRLLAFARRQPLAPQVLDLNNRLGEIETLIRRTLPENIATEMVRGAGLWRTELDPGQLEVALLNLALNARDAMPDGGRLTIETSNSWLDDDYAAGHAEVAPGQHVLISVSDTGHGMDSATVRRAFEPFFTTKQVGKGSGLGLSMVFGFVKQTGGHVKIYSEPGEGTTVKMYFRRAHGQEQPEETVCDGAAMRGSECILVVEDDILVRENLCNQLKNLGYRVISAVNGDEALPIIEERPDIDLLLTDIIMPGSMHGGALAHAVRKVRPDIKVLFTSGYTENSIVHNGRLDPGVDFLGKPYRVKQLARKLRLVLDR